MMQHNQQSYTGNVGSGVNKLSSSQRRVSREEAMAIKAEVDYQRLNKSFTDVTFIVGPPQHSKKYVGHRVLLAMTSPVFETMFYGDMADKSKYIRIPDVAPIGFENLLRYAYTDSLNLSHVEDAMLTAYAAKKYLLPQLLRECLTYIEHNIDPSTACVVFEFAQVLNSQQLVLQAMNLIDRQTNSVINNKSFTHVQANTVEFVANRKYLSLAGNEFSLLSAVINWSLQEAKRRQINQSDWLAIRSMLNENSILEAIKFLTMTQDEFAQVVARTSSQLEVVSSITVPAKQQQQQVLFSNNNSSADSNGLVDMQSGAGAMSGEGASNNNTDFPPAATAVAANDSSNNEGQINSNSSSTTTTAFKIDVENPNSLLTDVEQRAILLNLALRNSATLPPTINSSQRARQAPPEYFSLKRFRSSNSNNNSGLVTLTTNTRSIKSISSKFQCLSENVFIVGLTIPIRLDPSSYTNRTPKFECHLKFTTKTSASSTGGNNNNNNSSGSPVELSISKNSQQQHNETSGLLDGSTLLMDTIDESLHISIARDKDCLVRLKRPILIRLGNINELTLTFQTYALDEDIVALRTPKSRSANFSEQTDGENISWLFFKTANIEFSELHYYY